jgi:ABC-type bacteriocin/lantibiotic exporter with double-glycine peptidase domain
LRKIVKNIAFILNIGEKQKAITMALLSLIVSVIDIFSLVLLLFIINFYTQGSLKPISYLPGWLADRHSILLILIFFLFFIVKSIFGFLIFQSQNRFVYQVATRISQANLLRYLEGNYTDYTHLDSSVLIRKISQQPTEFCHYILAGFQQIISEGILIILTILTILFFNARLFLFLFLILLPAVIILSYFIKTRLRSVRAQIKTNGEKALQYLQEAVSGFIESNIYDKNRFFTDRYTGYQQIQNKFLSDLVVTQGISSRLIEVFAVFGLFILIVANHFIENSHAVELVTIGAFIAAAYKIIPGIVKILNVTGQIRTYEFTIDDLLKEAKKGALKKTIHPVKKINSVSFSQVSVSYQDHEILRNFNLEMHGGDFIGIAGQSGKGKSSLVNVLLGFLEASKGNVSINQIRMNAAERQSFWPNITYVKQQAFLLFDTISTNITLDLNQPDDPILRQSVVSSGLEELISKFPEGLQKVITQNGKNISGGQRQRITIARALYKDADLIILDEPFNELDDKSEREILGHFRELARRGKIILLITHNPASLSFCNKIVSLDAE